MNELKVYTNAEFGEVRTLLIEGEPWFVAADVCRALEIGNPSDALKRLEEDERARFNLGRQGEANIISEPGLYSLVMGSRKPEARAFRRWVTHEVIPSIRRTGGYTVPQTFSQALRALADAEEAREKLEEENRTMKPKADFYDAVVDSKTAIPMGDAAKIIGGIGRNRLFDLLRRRKILMPNNVPMQEYIDRGYFRVVESKFTKPNGDIAISIKTLVLQRGLDYIRKVVEENA